MKKTITVVFAVLVILLPFANTTEANSNTVPVRNGATSSYTIVSYLNDNQTYKVLDYFMNSLNELWYRVQIGNNKYGWVQASQVWNNNIKLSMQTIKHSEIRRGASKAYNVEKTVSSNQQILVIGMFTNSLGEVWYRVNYNNSYGWVHASSFDANHAPIDDDSVSVRKGATSSYDIVSYISKHDKVVAVGSFKNANNELWYNVSVNNRLGWVESTDVWKNSITLVMNTVKSTQVRKGASTLYEVIESISSNQPVELLGMFTNSMNETWYNVKVGARYGWLDASSVDISFSPPTMITSVPMRKGATTSYEVVTYVKTDQTIQVLDHFINANNELWYNIIYEGKRGWVNSINVWDEKNSIKLLMNTKVNGVIRKGATTSYDFVTSIKSGETIKVDNSFTNIYNESWYHVEYVNGNGWIHESLVNDLVSPSTIYPNMFSNGSNVPVRKGATTSYDVVESLDFNEEVKVIGIFVNNLGEIWLNVDLQTIKGWVKSDYLEFDKINNTRYSYYNYPLSEAINVQMSLSTKPQTDFYRNAPAYVHGDYVSVSGNGAISGIVVNLRSSPKLTNDANVVLQVSQGTPISILEQVDGDVFSGSTLWYRISYNGNNNLYVHSSLVNPNASIGVTTVNLKVRENANDNTSTHVYGTLPSGTSVTILAKVGAWYQISYQTWRNAKVTDVENYINPNNHDKFQHLLLSGSAGLSAADLRLTLNNKGSLHGKEVTFIDASRKYSVNEVYLLSHALLETGNGTSTLSNGSLEVGTNRSGDPVVVTSSNRGSLTNIKRVYNMFGIAAYDSNPINGGAKKAYIEGWYTPELAILGGAKWISDNYINHPTYQQNTLYKMRWNPSKPGTHQYATDIAWATKQINRIKDLYSVYPNADIFYDIPQYK